MPTDTESEPSAAAVVPPTAPLTADSPPQTRWTLVEAHSAARYTGGRLMPNYLRTSRLRPVLFGSS